MRKNYDKMRCIDVMNRSSLSVTYNLLGILHYIIG